MKRYLSVAALVAVVGMVVAVAVSDRTGPGRSKPPITRGVYVVSTTAGDVVKIDPATRQVTETIHLDASYLSSIAIAGEYLYYSSYGGSSSSSDVGRYNLSTKQNESTYIEQQFYAPLLRVSPTDPEILFVGESGLSPANIQKWSVPADGDDPSLLARTEHGPMGSNLGDFQISEDGSKIWSACGAPYEFVELNTSDLRLSGRTFPAVAYPHSIDSVSVGGTEYLLGGTNSSSDASIHLYNATDPASGVHYGSNGTTTESGSVALSPDGSKIYRVVTTDVDGKNASIQTLARATGEVLATTSVPISQYFIEGIHADPVTGRVFVSLDNAVGVLAPRGTLLETIPNVPGAGQMLIT